jgi:hypothetical protein
MTIASLILTVICAGLSGITAALAVRAVVEYRDVTGAAWLAAIVVIGAAATLTALGLYSEGAR